MSAALDLVRQVGTRLRLAWPVFAVFLAQRLLTVGFLAGAPGGLKYLTTRWDAGWYVRLAQGGYVYPNIFADGHVHPSNLAYFPLYPGLIHLVAGSGLTTFARASILVSWLGGLLAVYAIFAVGNELYGRWTGVALAALWGMAPASLALTMAYPEGMFTAAAAGTLYFLMRRRPVWAGGCAFVAGLLRPSALAVIAVVVVFFLVEFTRWLARRRAETDRSMPPVATAPVQGPTGSAFPLRALVGAVISTLGLGAFMVYVAARTGEVFGYFTVQAQWGQEGGSLSEYRDAIQQGLFETLPVVFIPVTVIISFGYLLLFCLMVFDRKLVWASIYAAGILVVSLTHLTFQQVYARQLLPAFVLLIPLTRMQIPRIGAIAALTVGSVVVSWGGAQFLLVRAAGM